MFEFAIPALHVSSWAAAEEFYCGRLGFRRQVAYGVDKAKPDLCYMGFTRDGVWLHVSSFSGDGVPGGAVFPPVEGEDALHVELVTKRVPIALEPTDQTWGNREMYVRDHDGNSIRFVSSAVVPVYDWQKEEAGSQESQPAEKPRPRTHAERHQTTDPKPPWPLNFAVKRFGWNRPTCRRVR